MEMLPRGKYTREFRLEAVKLVEGGLSAMEVGRRRAAQQYQQLDSGI